MEKELGVLFKAAGDMHMVGDGEDMHALCGDTAAALRIVHRYNAYNPLVATLHSVLGLLGQEDHTNSKAWDPTRVAVTRGEMLNEIRDIITKVLNSNAEKEHG